MKLFRKILAFALALLFAALLITTAACSKPGKDDPASPTQDAGKVSTTTDPNDKVKQTPKPADDQTVLLTVVLNGAEKELAVADLKNVKSTRANVNDERFGETATQKNSGFDLKDLFDMLSIDTGKITRLVAVNADGEETELGSGNIEGTITYSIFVWTGGSDGMIKRRGTFLLVRDTEEGDPTVMKSVTKLIVTYDE